MDKDENIDLILDFDQKVNRTTKHLSITEQKVMDCALRRSITIIDLETELKT